MNRRFVPFFFNRSGQGEGDDPAAAAFTKRKGGNPYAYLAAFAPDGMYLGEPELYADEDEVFDFLVGLLEEHAEYARDTPAERAVLDAAREERSTPGRLSGAARLAEELGRYPLATRLDLAIVDHPDSTESQRIEALSRRLRVTRHADDWRAHHEAHTALAAQVGGDAAWRDDLDVELGYRLVAGRQWARARDVLEADLPHEIQPGPAQDRVAERRFLAGVARWFLDDRPAAQAHWVWLVENLPDDRLAPRARWASIAEHVPYENPHLGGYRGEVGNVSPESVEEAWRRVLADTSDRGTLR